ncbi:MAG TPA: hypothetical protein VF062_02285 [Candidatus Limnocylindrales bacterium]
MTEESAYPCPVCHTLTTLEHPCPGCGRAPDPNAAAVITLDARIIDLRQRVAEARQRFDELSAELSGLLREREERAGAVRAQVAAEHPRSQETITTSPVAVDRAEASPKTVQTLLFVLGGIILGIAAIVFTGVAFTRFGMAGRAAILSGITLITLAVPPLVRRRGLRATAETFAALGFLLVILDGYAAWYVNLFGIQETWDLSFYQAAVLAVTACLAYGYALAFEVTGPRFIALAAAQPVLPLMFANADVPDEVWVLIFSGIALGNAGILWRRPKPLGLIITAWAAHGTAILAAFTIWAALLGTPQNALNSLALLSVAVAFAAGAMVSGAFAHRVAAGAALALALSLAIVLPLLPGLNWARDLGVTATATAFVALLAWLATRLSKPAAVIVPPPPPPVATEPLDERIPALWSTFDPAKAAPPPPPEPEPVVVPDPWSMGARLGAGAGLLVPGLIALGWALWLAAWSVVDATPWWHGSVAGPGWNGELTLSILLVTGGGWLLTRGAVRDLVAAAGLVALAFALPQPSIVDMVSVVLLLAWAILVPSRVFLKGGAAVLLAAHALATALGEPTRAMLVMAAIVALGFAVGTIAPRRGVRPLGGVFTGIGDLVFPWLAFTTVAAFGGSLVASWRMLLAFVILLPILGSPRAFRGYQVAAGLITMLYPLWPDLPPGESQALYASGAAVAAAIVVSRCAWWWAPWAATIPIFATLAWTFEDWRHVLPATAPADIWAGGGVTPSVSVPNAIALTVIIAPVAGLCWRLGWRRAVTIGVFASVLPLLMWLAVAGAPWPTLPAVTLLFGLGMLIVRVSPSVTVIGALLTLSGLSGASQEKVTTIVALSLIVVAMALIAMMPRSGIGARLGAWFSGAVAMVLLAYTVGETVGFDPEVTAYLVLLAGGILLLVAFTPLVRELRPAVEAAAHASAAVALALTAGSARAAAGVFAIWGVAIGLTALRTTRPASAALAGVAIGLTALRTTRPASVARAALAGVAEAIAWCLVVASYDVGTLEAYTLPVALIAVAVGVLSARGLSSWVAYGPALAAAMLPSLGAVLLSTEQLGRRLLLATAALIVVVAGAVWRKQAPFVLGGIVLVVLAVHEVVLIWQRVQTWIPLTVIGLILVGLAITYERRRRDLARLRDTVANMT